MTAVIRRAVVISHTYLDPALRGKLRALASRGIEVTVGVPQRWSESPLGRRIDTTWERQGGVETFPIVAHQGRAGDATSLRYGRRQLKALLRDKRPDLVQLEESPLTLAARDVVRAARRAGVPLVVLAQENVDGSIPWRSQRRRRRILVRARAIIATSEQ